MTVRKIVTFGAGTLFFLAGISPLFAQSGRIVATIPFEFTAGDTRMGAGEYALEKGPGGTLLLRNQESGRSIFVMAFPDRGLTDPVRAQLSFRRYGDAYFLQQVDWPGYENLQLNPVSRDRTT